MAWHKFYEKQVSRDKQSICIHNQISWITTSSAQAATIHKA